MTELEWLDEFSSNLKSIMYEADLSQRELSEISGLDKSTISNYLSKKRMPTIKAIVNMANALEVSTDELIDFEDTIY